MGLFGAIAAGVVLALYGVASAVEGVVLKQVADAWASAPAAEQAARFASAEAIRWLEWGIKSYQSFTVGLALVLFGMATRRASVLPIDGRTRTLVKYSGLEAHRWTCLMHHRKRL